MTRSPDILIIGGGVVGVCAAYELAREGASVTLVERAPELAAGASAGNAGIIGSSHCTPIANPAALAQGLRWAVRRGSPFRLAPRPRNLPWIARYVVAARSRKLTQITNFLRELAEVGISLHAEYATSGIESGFQRVGLLDAYESDAGLEFGRREVAARRAAGLPGQLLARGELQAHKPHFGPTVRGGAFYRDEAFCDPRRLVHALGGAAVDAGASLATKVEVLRLRARAGRINVVETTNGEFTPGVTVLAAGPWSPALTRPLGIKLPVIGAKGYHIDLERTADDPQLPVFLLEQRVVATPLADRLRLAGSLELTGLDMSVDPVRVGAIRRAGERMLPALRGRTILNIWRGVRPCAPDGYPVVGYCAAVNGLIIATGHCMSGNTLAPPTAKMIVSLAADRHVPSQAELFSPDRFRARGCSC